MNMREWFLIRQANWPFLLWMPAEKGTPVMLKAGGNELTVEADGSVSVEIRARGRW